MLNKFKQRYLAAFVMVAIALSPVVLYAANTILLAPNVGELNFPISPPTLNGTVPGAIDNMAIGATTPASGRFTTVNATGQITTSAGLPTIASGACGATTNGAVVAGSTNQAGNITIGAAATTTCTVSFSATLAAAPKACLITPTNSTAAAQGTALAYVSSVTTAQFVITGAVLASANYAFHCL